MVNLSRPLSTSTPGFDFATDHLLFLFPSLAQCNTLVCDSGTIDLPISDGDGTVLLATIAIQGLDVNMSNFQVQTFITHEYSSDLKVTLVSPSGLEIMLSSSYGGSRPDVFNGTIWSDSGIYRASNYKYVISVVAAVLQPDASFGGLGLDPNGDWVLKIVDNMQTFPGTLNRWIISVARMLLVSFHFFLSPSSLFILPPF